MKISKRTIAVVGIFALAKLWLGAVLDLHPDEAYYWLWSKFPAWGYFDHPPMVAFFIKATTLVSSSEIFVRFSAVMVSVALALVAYALAFEIFRSEKIAFWSVLFLNLMPISIAGFVMTPDIPLLFFWGVAAYFLKTAVARNADSSSENTTSRRSGFWALAGISFGAALLSKYTAVLFAPCALTYMILSPRARRMLATPYPYAALAAAALVFMPVVVWNARHDWISFAFQWKHGTHGPLKLANLADYTLAQLGVGGIFVFAAGLAASVKFLFSRDDGKIFLSSMSLPVIAFFGWASTKNPGEANWTAPAAFTLAPAAAAFFFEQETPAKKAWAVFSSLFLCVIAAAAFLHAAFWIIPVGRMNPKWALMDPTNRFYGWKEFAGEMEKTAAGAPVVAIDHQSAAALLYYSRMRIDVRSATNNFLFWGKYSSSVPGRCAAYDYTTDVFTGPVSEKKFSSIVRIGAYEAKRNGETIRTYGIYDCRDYNGR